MSALSSALFGTRSVARAIALPIGNPLSLISESAGGSDEYESHRFWKSTVGISEIKRPASRKKQAFYFFVCPLVKKGAQNFAKTYFVELLQAERSWKGLLSQSGQTADLTSSAALRNRAFACRFAESLDGALVGSLSFGDVLGLNGVESLFQCGAGSAADEGVASLALIRLFRTLRRFACICHDGLLSNHQRVKEVPVRGQSY